MFSRHLCPPNEQLAAARDEDEGQQHCGGLKYFTPLLSLLLLLPPRINDPDVIGSQFHFVKQLATGLSTVCRHAAWSLCNTFHMR